MRRTTGRAKGERACCAVPRSGRTARGCCSLNVVEWVRVVTLAWQETAGRALSARSTNTVYTVSACILHCLDKNLGLAWAAEKFSHLLARNQFVQMSTCSARASLNSVCSSTIQRTSYLFTWIFHPAHTIELQLKERDLTVFPEQVRI